MAVYLRVVLETDATTLVYVHNVREMWKVPNVMFVNKEAQNLRILILMVAVEVSLFILF